MARQKKSFNKKDNQISTEEQDRLIGELADILFEGFLYQEQQKKESERVFTSEEEPSK